MRLFLAVDLPDKVKKSLTDQLDGLIKEYPQFYWVSPENFHITVHFFGEVRDVKIISKKIKDLLWDQVEFYLYSQDCDVFVNHNLLLYLNFRREKKIEEMADKIKKNFVSNSVSERKYIPHLTLARGRRSSKQQYFALQRKLSRLNVDVGFRVNKVILFESLLNGKKPVYKKLSSFKLIK